MKKTLEKSLEVRTEFNVKKIILIIIFLIMGLLVARKIYHRIIWIDDVARDVPVAGTVVTWYDDDISAQVVEVKLPYSNNNSCSYDNIVHAASDVNGTEIRPGESFSWLRDVGPCGFQEGYKLAGAIPRPSFGGGICLVSTAMYRCANTANDFMNLEIEHVLHSSRPAYAPDYDDSTIDAETGKDLKIKNTTDDSTIVFYSWVDDDTRTVIVRGYVH